VVYDREEKMNRISCDTEESLSGIVEDFVTALKERNLCTGITGYKRRPEDGRVFVIDTKKGEISLQMAEITERDFTLPISRTEYDSGRYGHFVAKAPGEIPLAVDNDRLSTSIQRKVRAQLETPFAKSEHEIAWLLVYSNSGYPEVDCCVRGNKMDGEAVCVARDYLKNHEQVMFDQIWYTNLVTLPVRIWPHHTGMGR